MTLVEIIYGIGWVCRAEEFYESGLFAIVPMDFYFPGHGKSGDLGPRKGFADKWHREFWI